MPVATQVLPSVSYPPVSRSLSPDATRSRIRHINGIPLTDAPNAWREFCRPSPEPDEEPFEDEEVNPDDFQDDRRPVGLGSNELVALVIPRDVLAALTARAAVSGRYIDEIASAAIRWYFKIGNDVATVGKVVTDHVD